MRSDVKLFAFTRPVAQFERFLPIGLGQLGLLQVVVDGPQACVAHGKHGVEFNSALVVGEGAHFVAHVVLAVSHAQGLERVEG